jgi:hypothetical protein
MSDSNPMDNLDDIYDASPVEANHNGRDNAGNNGAVGAQSYADNSPTNRNASEAPVTYPTLPSHNGRVENLREDPQLYTTSSSNNPMSTGEGSSTSASSVAPGSHPAQSEVNASVPAAETQRPVRIPFMSPPRNGYTSSIP